MLLHLSLGQSSTEANLIIPYGFALVRGPMILQLLA